MAQQQFNIHKGKHNIADIDTALDRVAGLDTEFAAKQAKLVSGTNIKTVNNQSILGSGNIEIESPTDAEDIDITTIEGLTATNVQTALAQIYAKAKTGGLSDAQIAAAIATYLASHPIEGVAEAPKDGKQYARKDGVWSEVQATSGDSNVQADWNQTDSTKDDYIKNKPTIPDAYTKAEVDTKVGANSALIASLQQNGLPTGSGYSFTFVEEAVMEGLTAENTTAAVLYFGLEEDESAAATYDSASGIITANGTYDASTGIVTVSGTYDSATGIITL